MWVLLMCQQEWCTVVPITVLSCDGTNYCTVGWPYQLLLYSWVTIPTTVQLGDHTNYCTVRWPYQLLYSWMTVPSSTVQLGDGTIKYCTVGWPYQLLYSRVTVHNASVLMSPSSSGYTFFFPVLTTSILSLLLAFKQACSSELLHLLPFLLWGEAALLSMIAYCFGCWSPCCERALNWVVTHLVVPNQRSSKCLRWLGWLFRLNWLGISCSFSSWWQMAFKS
jgi:hypothetical protein